MASRWFTGLSSATSTCKISEASRASCKREPRDERDRAAVIASTQELGDGFAQL